MACIHVGIQFGFLKLSNGMVGEWVGGCSLDRVYDHINHLGYLVLKACEAGCYAKGAWTQYCVHGGSIINSKVCFIKISL